MLTHVPFSNFIVRISNIRLPLELSDWVEFFKEDFRNIQVEELLPIDLQFARCKSYKIHFDAPVILTGKFGIGEDSFSTLPFAAILFNSDKLYYLLLGMGNDHIFGTTASRSLKVAPQIFQSLGGGKFISNPNNILISFEEDESDNTYYNLSTSSQTLMDMDDLFNFAKEMLKRPKK